MALIQNQSAFGPIKYRHFNFKTTACHPQNGEGAPSKMSWMGAPLFVKPTLLELGP